MKVYVVLRENAFGDIVVDKVFDSQDKARDFVIDKYYPNIPQDQQIRYADQNIYEKELK